jgi:hypothetical protein
MLIKKKAELPRPGHGAQDLQPLLARKCPLHTRLPWHCINARKQHFIYADQDVLVCVVMRQFQRGVSPANAEFIVRACNHHYELTRLVKAAAYILADACDDFAWPGLGVSSVSAKEFCRRATELLHTAEPGAGR